jgi:hypothetical protein
VDVERVPPVSVLPEVDRAICEVFDVSAVENVQREAGSPAFPAISGEAVQEAVEQYLLNPVFRAARYEELVLDDNPYRRPVRPDDLGMVDFSMPLRRADFSQLSALMGHRMLLNIYDTERLFLPRRPSSEKWRDYRQFYGATNRFLGAVIRPYLEAHLFGFLEAEVAASTAPRTASALVARVREIGQQRARAAAELRDLIAASPDRDGMIQMLAVQALARSLNSGARPAAALGDLAPSAALPAALTGPAGTDVLGASAEVSGIKDEPHSYFQYYLPSTLALMNYFNRAAGDPGRVFAFAGVLAAQSAETRALREEPRSVADEPERPGPRGRPARVPDDDAGSVVAWAERAGGDFALQELGRGLDEYAVLLDVQHEDRMRQFRWIDAMPSYVQKARRLQAAITENEIDVDLDTFVESWEECSTTHVHDDDRLLVIESGEMEFWNCFGTRHKFHAGDMTFIPRHRLHGSVVLTGECTYHQPVITAELDRKFG